MGLNVLFALIGCTGLLIGNFNRRGQIKIVSFSVGAMIILQALDLAFTNLAYKHLGLLSLVYLNLLLPFIICLLLFKYYTPATFLRKKASHHIGGDNA